MMKCCGVCGVLLCVLVVVVVCVLSDGEKLCDSGVVSSVSLVSVMYSVCSLNVVNMCGNMNRLIVFVISWLMIYRLYMWLLLLFVVVFVM